MECEREFVELLIERFQIELRKQDRSGIYGLTQRKIAYNSNKIEGSTLSEQHTASLFETGSLKANGEIIRAKDVEEMTGHFAMFNHMLKTLEEPLSEKLIKEFHHNLKSGVFEDMANGYLVGEFKTRRNWIGIYETTPPENVEKEIKRLLEEYGVNKIHTLKEITDFHAKYEMIHPFQDGNGRTGRIIAFGECLRSRVMPFVVQDKNKEEYLYALRDYREGNKKSLYVFFEKEQNSYFFDEARDAVLPCLNKGIDIHITEAKKQHDNMKSKTIQIQKELKKTDSKER